MNNRGQVLIIFVIMLPIFLILFTLVVDLGLLHIEKRNINNNVIDAVEYYLNNSNDINIEEKIKTLLNKNVENIDEIKINNNDHFIEITLIKKYKSIYSVISTNRKIEVNYKGFKKNNRIIKG